MEQPRNRHKPLTSLPTLLKILFVFLLSIRLQSKLDPNQKFLKAPSKLEPAKLAMAPSCPRRARPPPQFTTIRGIEPVPLGTASCLGSTEAIPVGAKILFPEELQGPRIFIMHPRPLTWHISGAQAEPSRTLLWFPSVPCWIGLTLSSPRDKTFGNAVLSKRKCCKNPKPPRRPHNHTHADSL